MSLERSGPHISLDARMEDEVECCRVQSGTFW